MGKNPPTLARGIYHETDALPLPVGARQICEIRVMTHGSSGFSLDVELRLWKNICLDLPYNLLGVTAAMGWTACKTGSAEGSRPLGDRSLGSPTGREPPRWFRRALSNAKPVIPRRTGHLREATASLTPRNPDCLQPALLRTGTLRASLEGLTLEGTLRRSQPTKTQSTNSSS
jgi:hypothetical protein